MEQYVAVQIKYMKQCNMWTTRGIQKQLLRKHIVKDVYHWTIRVLDPHKQHIVFVKAIYAIIPQG